MAALGPFASATTTKLAAESPPFNPRLGLLGGGPSSSTSLTPPHSRNPSRSRSASPFTGVHYGGGAAGTNNNNSSNNLHQHHLHQHQHQHHRSASSSASSSSTGAAFFSSANSNAVAKYAFQYQGQTLEIRNVWAENVEEEMAVIRQIIERYNYVAMDTEFPGIVAKPVTEAYSPDYHYKSLKVNVDLLKIIQLGLSFADEQGNFAPGCPCWQFNFAFDLEGDMFAQDSIDLLQKSGISFEDHARRGIDPVLFGELLMVSGLVLDDRVKWVSFHSGYDYGYLLKLLTTTELPADEKSFFELLRIYFPTIYDIKFMTSLLDGHQFMGGLQKLADDLGCQRLGGEHQAGSDSLLTMATYFALVKAKFTAPGDASGRVDDSKFANELFGYGTNHTVRKGGGVGVGRDISGGSTLSGGLSD